MRSVGLSPLVYGKQNAVHKSAKAGLHTYELIMTSRVLCPGRVLFHPSVLGFLCSVHLRNDELGMKAERKVQR